jgi:phosphoenolpyruvate carboxykinase (ATP)
MSKMAISDVGYNVRVIEDPDQKQLRELALRYTPAVIQTAHGNLNKISRNKARMAQYTYVIASESDASQYSCKLIDPSKAKELITRQKAYIEKSGTLIAINGYLGLGPKAVAVQWLYTTEGANIAGMQQVLCFPRNAVESGKELEESFKPTFRVVYTPDFFVEDMPGRQAILVDLQNYITYIMGPDYFGESKKSALRMLNDYVYRQGGLVLHAGAKSVRFHGRTIGMTIMGLSGTGKTTTTFSKQGDLAQPIQDDMVCIWPGGQFTITENGCFAKTYGLTAETEPVIYEGTIHPSAWVENNYVSEDGTYDFSKGMLTPKEVKEWRDILIQTGASQQNVDAYITGKVKKEEILDSNDVLKDGWDFVIWTQNGRSIIPMSAIKDAADFNNVPKVQSMGILNRDEGSNAATPGILRFTSPQQAAGYFMLGETTKTSAAGKDRGKTRSPFTQPFFPRAHGLQAKRFSEIAATMENVDMWEMNTGYIGGTQKDIDKGQALKVKIRHSSAMLEKMLSGQIRWKRDPDFGYEIVDVDAPENRELLELVPKEIVNPRIFYEQKGRMDEYKHWVVQMKKERKQFLEQYNVDPSIIHAVTNY